MTTIMRYVYHCIYAFLVLLGFTNTAHAQQVTLIAGSTSGMQGDIVCIDITAENYNKITSMEWRSRFDPKILQFSSLEISNSALNENGANLLGALDFNTFQGANGYVSIAWANGPVVGLTLPDGAIIYTLCFEIIGNPCESSIVSFTGNPSEIEVGYVDDNGIDQAYQDGDIVLVPGLITVDPAGFAVVETHCSTDDAGDTGSITFAGSGGNGPYDWQVTGPGTNVSGTGLGDCEVETVNDLGPGTYTITFTDQNNTIQEEMVNIVTSSDFPFILTLDPTDPRCFDKDNGSIAIANIEGGDAPFTYEWSTLNFLDDNIDDLLPGEYSLTITDVNGCSTSASTILAADTVKIEVDVLSGPSCGGAADGIVSFTASGGTAGANGRYEFEIRRDDPFFNGNSIVQVDNPYTLSNMPEGCFTAVAIDDNNCDSETVEFCLDEGSFTELTLDTTNISCFGACDGQVLINVATAGNYSFQLFDPSGTLIPGSNTNISFDKNDLCPGKYTMTINDVIAGCSIDTSFTITEPDILELSVVDSLGPGCGGGDGMITLSSTGGTEDYTYVWNDGFDEPTRTDMEGGDYAVTVIDANGCRDSILWTFGDGGDIGLSAIVCQAVTCASNQDGSVCASVTAAGTFTFSWEDSEGNSIGNGAQIDNLGGGIYFVTATDGTCTDSDMVIVAPGETPSVTFDAISPTCPAGDDGQITATLFEGVSPATFSWSKPPLTMEISAGQVVTGEVGEYLLSVTDANGCVADTLVELLPDPDSIMVDITDITGVTCFGECNGSAMLTASGGPMGIGDYTFIINGLSFGGAGSTLNFNMLCAGENTLQVIDGSCISAEIIIAVMDAEPIMVDEDLSTIENPSCFGNDDGSITVVIVGGDNSSYDIEWTNLGETGNTVTGLVDGDYFLEITDGSGCVANDTVTLETPNPLELTINPLTTVDISCFSDSQGRIGLTTSGGNAGDLDYSWSPSVSTTDFAEDLSPGFYSVTVTDSRGCTAETEYTLTSAPPVMAVVDSPGQPECFGGQVCLGIESVSGGLGSNYTFTINNGPRIPVDTCLNVFAGPYLVTVFDSAGCAVDTMITIAQPQEITVDVGPDLEIDLGESSEPVSAFIVSELDIDSIIWTPFGDDVMCETSDCQVVTFDPISTTTYEITVIDENGCSATDEIVITVDLERNVFTANIFSPNGDNINDFFQLSTGSGVELVNYLKIFDRWGNQVFQDEVYMPNDTDHRGWDGTYNGQPIEPGVYVYFAEVAFTDGVVVLFKGDVTAVK